MMRPEQCIHDDNLSRAWYKAARKILEVAGKEHTPLSVAITGFQEDRQPFEDPAIADVLDAYLVRTNRQTTETVANTIFPWSLWNRAQPRSLLFERYLANLPRLRRASSKNSKGLYFERMVTGGPEGKENQLEFILNEYGKRKGHRRSALQVGVFQPQRDHSGAAQRGFPCLQHVTFAPTRTGLFVNAMYASQYLMQRAYGNYLGICRLGAFIAKELGLQLAQVTCFTGIMQMEDSKREVKALLDAIDSAGGTHEG